MTFEEFKTTLMSSQTEGADVTTIYDNVLTEAADLYKQLDEKTNTISEKSQKIEELSNCIVTLTDNNLKLLDKVRYMDDSGTSHKEDDAPITQDDLFIIEHT